MVFGNLSTGYWLGAAAGAGLHWIELGRKTLTGTSDTIEVAGALSSLSSATFTQNFSQATPTAWTEDSSSGYANNLEPYKSSSNGLWFDLDQHLTVGVMGMLDLQNSAYVNANPSNTKWTMRFKINFSSLSSAAGNMFIGLTDSNSAGANGACRFAGVRFKIGDGIRNISDNGGQSLVDSNRTDGGLASTITTGTDYYITISRHTANRLVTTVRSGSHTGTVVGEVTADTLETATDDLRYWKIMNHRASTNGGQLQGYLYDLEFFNNSAVSAGDLTQKPYMMILGHNINSGAVRTGLRFNGDTGNNYAHRRQVNGATDATNVNHNRMVADTDVDGSDFTVSKFINISAQEKLGILSRAHQSGSGAGNAPDREEMVGKWTNTSDNITNVQSYNAESGDFAIGSECVVLGYDPDDSEGTSVWEELKGVSVGSDSATISTGTISAKKYLWIQVYLTATAHDFNLQFNGDTGSNYTKRRSENGGSDSTNTSQDRMTLGSYNSSADDFYNIFIINKSDKEKLAIIENSNRNTAGAGNAPNRSEYVAKWTNTSAQITSIVALQQSGGSGNFGTGSYMKVWGFD